MNKIKMFGKEYELIEHDWHLAGGIDLDNDISAFGDLQYTLRRMKEFARSNGAKGRFEFRFCNIKVDGSCFYADLYLLSRDKKVVILEKLLLEDLWFGIHEEGVRFGKFLAELSLSYEKGEK